MGVIVSTMRYFEKIADGIDVAPIVEQLSAHPKLWDANPMRRVYPGSPHREMQDIWVRAREWTGDDLQSYSEPHKSVWWPAAAQLPAIWELVPAIMDAAGAHTLGGVLVTKIPAGNRIYAHHDRGFWHAEYHNRKVYLCVQGNDDCVVWCEDERVVMRAGEAWVFDNQVMHGLENSGNTDRISVIYAMRAG